MLLGSGTAALLAAVLLRIRDRRYRAIREQETVDDDDHDGTTTTECPTHTRTTTARRAVSLA